MSRDQQENPNMGPDAALKQYSLELLSCVDEMRYKRDCLHKQILNEMKEKEKIQNDLRKITDRLVKVNETICDKVVARNRLDDTIKETESAFTNLATSSENLLQFMKKVTATILPEILTEESSQTEQSEKKKKHGRKSDTPKR
ncbi:Sjoegren syndrome nuclear autoantigen 1 [Mactra antiquata]